MTFPSPLAEDLDDILSKTPQLWEPLKNQSLLITGGTGFIGKWLMESFLYANTQYHLKATITALSRDPSSFLKKYPHFNSYNGLSFIEGDIRHFSSNNKTFDYVIHGAADADTKLIEENPQEAYDVILQGTKHLLDEISLKNAKRFLFLSSGSVQDSQKGKSSAYSQSLYTKGKLEAENFLLKRPHQINLSIARCFTFLGPYLPLNRHYAVGNFIRDALSGGPIILSGDGTAVRSYLYASDMAIWLWTLLIQGQHGRIYNVGSEKEIDVLSLATRISTMFTPSLRVERKQQPNSNNIIQRYVPHTQLTKKELGLSETIDLDTALKKMMAWAKTEIAKSVS